MKLTLTVLSLLCAVYTSMLAQESETNTEVSENNKSKIQCRLKGLAFGDAYFIPQHHLLDNDDSFSGAVLRRGYLTFDTQWGERWKSRIRFELNQSGSFETYTFEADLKDLYLTYQLNKHQFTAGLSPSLTFDVVEKNWGKRYLMRTPMDLQGIASREVGITAKGPICKNGKFKYRAMIGNGEYDFGNETGDGLKYMGAISYQPNEHWLVDFYADYEQLKGKHDQSTIQVFGAYNHEKIQCGLLFSYQDRQIDPLLEVASLYVKGPITHDIQFISRMDRVIEPSPKGDNISYIPFSSMACANLYLNGIEFDLKKWLYLTPNVIYTSYQHLEDGTTPEDDLYYRLTLCLNFE